MITLEGKYLNYSVSEIWLRLFLFPEIQFIFPFSGILGAHNGTDISNIFFKSLCSFHNFESFENHTVELCSNKNKQSLVQISENKCKMNINYLMMFKLEL